MVVVIVVNSSNSKMNLWQYFSKEIGSGSDLCTHYTIVVVVLIAATSNSGSSNGSK